MPNTPGQLPLIPLPEDLKESLEPFASLLECVILPEAERVGMDQPASAETLERVCREIDSYLSSHLGHTLHPALVHYALLLCCNFYAEPFGKDRLDEEFKGSWEEFEELSDRLDSQRERVNRAFKLIRELQIRDDTFDSIVLLS